MYYSPPYHVRAADQHAYRQQTNMAGSLLQSYSVGTECCSVWRVEQNTNQWDMRNTSIPVYI